MTDRPLDLVAAAAFLGCSTYTLAEKARAGEVRGVKCGGWKFMREDLVDFVRNGSQKPSPQQVTKTSDAQIRTRVTRVALDKALTPSKKNNRKFSIPKRAPSKAEIVKRKENRKALSRFHSMKRQTHVVQRTPKWADIEAIKTIYFEAQKLTQTHKTPYHVDHIVPLLGRKVSGLHVEYNLQILRASENMRKNNKFE